MWATWRRGKAKFVTSSDELWDLMLSIDHAEHPTILILEPPGGKALTLGLGRPEVPLGWLENDDFSFRSRGDVGRSGFVVFDFLDEPGDHYRESLVPKKLAMRAAIEFFETRQRPRCIEWEADQ